MFGGNYFDRWSLSHHVPVNTNALKNDRLNFDSLAGKCQIPHPILPVNVLHCRWFINSISYNSYMHSNSYLHTKLNVNNNVSPRYPRMPSKMNRTSSCPGGHTPRPPSLSCQKKL